MSMSLLHSTGKQYSICYITFSNLSHSRISISGNTNPSSPGLSHLHWPMSNTFERSVKYLAIGNYGLTCHKRNFPPKSGSDLLLIPLGKRQKAISDFFPFNSVFFNSEHSCYLYKCGVRSTCCQQ